MAQHDYNIANQSGADFRSDLNNALSAIASTNSGDTAPATTFANQLWIDTANNLLKIRNEANSAWITTGISITADNTFNIDGGTINGITALSFSSGSSVTTILDEDNLASDSATALATQQSIKAYVDSQVGSVDTLAEILSNGNTTNGTDIEFGDNDKAIFGAGSDLQIYHNGNNSIIQDAGTGKLNLISDGTEVQILGAGGSQVMARFIQDAQVRLNYNGSQKLETTATGIDVTGTVVSDGLTVDGLVEASGNLTLDGAGQQINFTGGGTNKITSNTSLNLDFDTDNDQSGMDFTISHNGGTNLFAINNSGYVGIGTDTPDESLVISGTGDLYAKITTTNDTDEVGILFGDTSASQAGRIVYEPNFDIMQFWTNNSEKYRVDTNGNMYIGRTDGNVSTSEHGVAFTNVGRIKNSVNVAGGGVVTEMYGTAGQFRIKGDGDAENTNNSYGAISDERLKENIADATPKLEKLKQVQIKTFNLVDHDLQQIGVIAQELENVFPSLVKDNDDGYKTVKYSVFVPILIKAIQELEQQVADLTQRLDGE